MGIDNPHRVSWGSACNDVRRTPWNARDDQRKAFLIGGAAHVGMGLILRAEFRCPWDGDDEGGNERR